MASTGMPMTVVCPNGGEGRRRLGDDRDAVAVGVDEAAGQGEHAQGDDERLEPAERDQPAVHRTDGAADDQGDDQCRAAPTDRRTGPPQTTAARPSAEPTLMSMPPVSTTISSASTTTPMIDICSSRLVRLVAAPEDRAPGDGGDHEQGDKDVEGVLRLEPVADGLAAGECPPRGGAPEAVSWSRVMESSSFAGRVGNGISQSWWVRAVRIRSSVSACSGSNSPTIWPLRITRMRWHSDSSSSASLDTTSTPLPRAATRWMIS